MHYEEPGDFAKAKADGDYGDWSSPQLFLIFRSGCLKLYGCLKINDRVHPADIAEMQN
jgi:hypothetical protein